MKNMKKFLALGLAVVMTLSLAACGNSSGGNSSANTDTNTNTNVGTDTNSDTGNASASSAAPSDVYIGTWWTEHTFYDSNNTDISDKSDWESCQDKEGQDEATLSQNALNRQSHQMMFDNKSKIEEKYGIKFYFNNLTYSGCKESINTSIMAGSPDCDIYLVEPGVGIPAQLNGLAVDLKTILPEDDDIFTEQKNVSYLDIGDGKACLIVRAEAQAQVASTYPLAFNVQMLEDNNLEDPRDLWERGEWTWDKFNEYMQVLTQDTDGDGQIDQYGYCGYENETLSELMMSNGTGIAMGPNESLSSSATGEVLQQIYDMYNVNNVCYPYDFTGTPSDSMRNQYTQGNIGFFPCAAWIQSGNGDYDWDGTLGTTLPFDVAYVRWPVGPSGNKDTNAGKNALGGEFYMIAAGGKNPEQAYHVLYDMWNWYDGDTSIRDSKELMSWWYRVTAKDTELQDANFDVMFECGAKTGLDLWESLGVQYQRDGDDKNALEMLINGEMTPAQFQESFKQQVQDGLDAYFG
ncbi:MAG: extracellular solute-binding protein [Clostridiales bacterium]|nr:extracellular solute-binding protein [Clostridiales bacterium]